jgi:hypothetical protein
MANHLNGLCSKEQADATLAKANERLKEVQETLYDVMFTNK